ncbi:MAG: TetR/AcrR family transcriptional regulator [Sulfobacillus thermosulfidooxidans]|nr:MAG: TetR/AcrR family transcriptional regulator [Sulfobacillus thermosulfidooxidans]
MPSYNRLQKGASPMSTRTVQKHATHQKIFSTALHLFRTQGFEQTSVDQIVRAAGVSKGSFFVHFPTKKAIFTTYVDHLTDTFLPSLPKWLALPPIDGLHQATKALTQVAEQDYALLPYIIEAELLAEPWDDGRLSSLHHIFDPLITHAQSAGVVRSDLSAAQLADHWLSTFFISLIWAFRHGEPLTSGCAVPLQLAWEGMRNPS